MTARAYEEYLSRERISAACGDYGFDNPRRVERHVMDFEVHRIVSRNVSGYVRGGMAAPFYMSGYPARLSEDIDIYVFETVDATRALMLRLGAEFGALGITMEEYKPRGGGLPIPLVTYRMWYATAMGAQDKVKIDLLCDARLEYLPHREFEPPINLGHFSTRHPVVALDAGALVADKITSLSIGTIGYPPDQKRKMNKQIYDMGQLLKHMQGDQIEQAIHLYDGLAARKCGYAREFGKVHTYGTREVTDGVCGSLLAALGVHDRFVNQDEFRDNFGGFKGTHLGKRPYSLSAHRSDALLVLLLAAALLEHGRGGISTGRAAGVVKSAAEVLKLMEDPSTRRAGRVRIDDSPRSDPSLEGRIQNLPPESQYLLRQVSSVSPGLLERRR